MPAPVTPAHDILFVSIQISQRHRVHWLALGDKLSFEFTHSDSPLLHSQRRHYHICSCFVLVMFSLFYTAGQVANMSDDYFMKRSAHLHKVNLFFTDNGLLFFFC